MNASKETLIRSIVTLLAVINQLLVSFGVYPQAIDESTIFSLVSAIVTIGTVVWAWWKNNSFTPNAVKADEYLQNLNKKE